MRRLFSGVLILLVIAGVCGGVFAVFLWSRLNEPYKGYAVEEQFVEIPTGTSTAAIGQRLVDAGIVRDYFVFRLAVLAGGRSSRLRAGEYRFVGPLTASQVVERLVRGDVYTRRITFPEGLTIIEMGKLYEAKGFGTASSFAAAARNASLIADLDAAAPDLEGYLFPSTYDVTRTTPASTVIAAMIARFKAVYSEDMRRQAAAQHLSARQVVTLASLVEKETGHDSERPVVAAVFRNRMKIGMAMQADPTLIYALVKRGHYDGNIRKADFELNSPYNTYKYPGLPPGPIAAPGKASLAAALAPADVKYLYFVSRNDGTHVFAETLAEHNSNVQKYQLQFFRAQEGEKGGRGKGKGGRGVSGNRK